MATEEWLEAARNYSRMPERARSEYWGQLTSDQQNALQEALALTGKGGNPASVMREQAPVPARRGCSSPLAAGCLGVIIGCILTIGVEVAAIMMGVQAVGNTVKGLSSGSSSSGGNSAGTDQPNDTNAVGCENSAYRSAHLYECDRATWNLENRKAHHPDEYTHDGKKED